MSAVNDDTAGAMVAFVSGAIIGAAVTLLFVRAQRNRLNYSPENENDYYYEGGDLFI